MRAAVYLRISQDRDGTSTATARQLDDCRKHAEARGWEVVETFEDSDLSAFKRGVVRPGFERMVEAVKAREIDVVMSWKLDRLSRRLRDFARLDEECETAGARIVTLVDGIDTGTSAGRVVATIMGALARAESENISIRGARKAAELAAAGRPNTGGTRGFGYSRDRATIINEEAATIREAARRIMAGEPVRAVCRDWEARGITSPAGKPWQQTPLRRMLCSAGLSGQREHRGNLTSGTWPAILTPEDTARLRDVLQNPARTLTPGNARKHLLSGFVRCGHCGEPLTARPDAKNGRLRYVCARQPSKGNCGKLARMAGPVDDTVFEALCVALEGANLAAYIQTTDDAIDLFTAVRGDEARLEQLSVDHYRDSLIDRAEYFAARDAVRERLEANRAILAKRRSGAILADVLAGEALRQRWPVESLEWRRAVIAAVIDHIVVEPAVKGRNTFDPALVRIAWRA